jgi:hypothetical protein
MAAQALIRVLSHAEIKQIIAEGEAVDHITIEPYEGTTYLIRLAHDVAGNVPPETLIFLPVLQGVADADAARAEEEVAAELATADNEPSEQEP